MRDLRQLDTEPRAFVLGWPVAQSRSPSIHRHWLTEHGLIGCYERVAVPPEDAPAFLESLVSSRYVGGNVTVPHKELAYRLAGRCDAVADAIGAVNTLWIEGGQLCATNTDAHGFVANLDDSAPDWDKKAKRAVVLGAGGAARAVVWALTQRGLEVAIVNRSLDRAADLVSCFPGSGAHAWSALPSLLATTDVLVNTTPLGMESKSELQIDLAPLPTSALVTDIVYVPLETPLLAAAQARGNPTVDGLGMLLHQAVPGFERWFGVRPKVTPELRRLIVADLEATAL
jgi:shikimate dehydrogenase